MSFNKFPPQGTGENDPLWGACSCPSNGKYTCSVCQHAEELEVAGLDWEEEYQKSLESWKTNADEAE